MSAFSRYAPRLQEAIVARLGWARLRPVQELAGEALLDGHNAVILAPTAGGKTEAAIFPALSMLMEAQTLGVGVLYIAPIKALLNNQAERLGAYTEMVGLRRFVWHGDTPAHARRQQLKSPAELLMTTPESLEVMLISQRVDASLLFKDLRMVIIDEVHALAGSDRGAHLMSVLERLAALSQHDVQRVGLSATVGNPAEIAEWLRGSSARASVVIDPPHAPAPRELLIVLREELSQLARDAARLARGRKSLLFCQSRATTEAMAEHMRRAGVEVFVHHSAVSYEERQLAEARFHHGSDACIVCTSTLELGIDVGDLDLVMQAEAPATVSAFLQRMGRTGRRKGQRANTTFLCETTEGALQALALIALARTGWVEPVTLDDRCWPVLIHQVLAMALERSGVSAQRAWEQLSRVPDFSGISRAEYDALIQWMLNDGALRLASNLLVLGPKAERRFGRKNFMELFAVFTSPKTYNVQTEAAQPLGTLSQDFVDRLVDGISSFLLGGRAWSVVRVQHDDRRVIVTPGSRAKEPTWGGHLPHFLSRALCEQLEKILRDDALPACLDPAAARAITDHRALMHEALHAPDGVEVFDDELRWWTFAGGRINATLRYAIHALEPDWQLSPDNLMVRMRGESVSVARFEAVRVRLREVGLWQDEALWGEVAEALPNYRLSKFQPLMPPAIAREVVARYLLDVPGAWAWLSEASSLALSGS